MVYSILVCSPGVDWQTFVEILSPGWMGCFISELDSAAHFAILLTLQFRTGFHKIKLAIKEKVNMRPNVPSI
jgi:hypothetical protein